MDNRIRELIESATAKGTITEEERAYIIKRAAEIGIDDMEVQIFINSNLHQKASAHSAVKTSAESDVTAGWLPLNEFKFGHWIVLLAVVLI